MENNENREFVVIVHLTEYLANKLNVDNTGGKNYGLECRCKHGFRELNCNNGIHGTIDSRIFYAQDVQSGDNVEIFMEDRTGEENKKIASVSFAIPDNREFEIVELVDSSKILTDEVLKLFRK